jgi:hypothetical protein
MEADRENEMQMVPNHVLLDYVGRGRQARFRAAAVAGRRPAAPARVRFGHALIRLGASLAGDRLEGRIRHTTACHPA